MKVKSYSTKTFLLSFFLFVLVSLSSQVNAKEEQVTIEGEIVGYDHRAYAIYLAEGCFSRAGSKIRIEAPTGKEGIEFTLLHLTHPTKDSKWREKGSVVIIKTTPLQVDKIYKDKTVFIENIGDFELIAARK